jgi:cytidylate kinase
MHYLNRIKMTMAHLFRGRSQQKPQRNKQQTQLLPETMWANEPLPSGIPPVDGVVVTISRQFGSGGAEIGRIVAQESGLSYVDHAIIDEVARRLGVNVQQAARQDEQTAGSVGHILEAIRSSNPFTVDYSTLFGQELAPAQSRDMAYLHLTQKVMLELATQGNAVIIGRGSQFLLHNLPRTLHVYIFAPLPYRIANVMKHFQLDHDRAADLIEQRDYEHDTYLRHNYGNDGHQPGLYHLLINTGLFSFELAADLIRQTLPLAKEIGASGPSKSGLSERG